MKPERHVAKVTANAHPEKLGALRVESQTLSEGEDLGRDWIHGVFPFAGAGEGFFYPPTLGALVEVEIEADPERSVEDLDARWVGCRYARGEEVPAEFGADRGGIKFGDEVLLQDRDAGLTALVSSALRLGEENASHPLTRGDNLNSALNNLADALDIFANGVNAQVSPLAPGIGAVCTALQGAVATFKAALPGALSTKCKTE